MQIVVIFLTPFVIAKNATTTAHEHKWQYREDKYPTNIQANGTKLCNEQFYMELCGKQLTSDAARSY
jgi:hypothetical protein